MEKIQMVDLYNQYLNIKSEIDQAIQRVIAESAYIKGPDVKRFEQNLADYLGVNHVIGTGNGTDALQVALMTLGLEQGDEVIIPDFTFISTAEVCALLGLKPVFTDVDQDTYNIDSDKIKTAITSRTKAIIPVHLYGQPADMEAIQQIAHDNGLWIIEDAAQATGSEYTFSDDSTYMAGSIGHIGCTSFFPTKNLSTFGDGGALITNDEKTADIARAIVNHGAHRKYYHERVGINSRLDTLHAAILDVKLKYLDQYNTFRRKVAFFYDNHLNDIPEIQLPVRDDASKHIFHQYTLQITNDMRDSLQKFLKSYGIPSMVYYPVPMHRQEAFASRTEFTESKFPESDRLVKQVLSLPMHTELTREQLNYIIETIRKFFKK